MSRTGTGRSICSWRWSALASSRSTTMSGMPVAGGGRVHEGGPLLGVARGRVEEADHVPGLGRRLSLVGRDPRGELREAPAAIEVLHVERTRPLAPCPSALRRLGGT